MKVLHLISGGDTGGAKTHVISLIKELNKLIDAKVICFIEDIFYYDALEAGIDIEVFKQKKRTDISVVKRLEEEIIRKDYDIIHCHGARANFIAMFLKNKIKKPMITTIHSDYKLDFKDNFYKRIVYTTLNSIALKKFDYYIAISDTFKDMMESRGFEGDKIFTVYNGIDLESEIEYVSKEEFLKRYNISGEGKLIVGIIARLDAVKDHETFIKGAYKVLQQRKDVIFLIAGTGSEEKRLKSLVKEMRIEDYIHFLGYVKDPYSFFNAIDINVLTSISESFPYVILEGARLKKTIISTNVGGINKLIKDGYNGWLIDVGDSNALAEKIIFFMENKEMIKTMGENLFKSVKENFSSKNMAEEHYKIYKQILESRR
ncbi:glycosyltransferase involved in cell wall biosynthesis [Keratinibaculum paraultunense]|uniref:Glycosyltransferase involved in cell wall biosynthesis n=1 Tax=Keratinibaculum paraultunense TaxID=1278232 RepID=A0A4R3L0W7_9FIRM|nr:glycosyltransferase involved in cell wall biosynthesis [Keratinibaculum paraultunense]